MKGKGKLCAAAVGALALILFRLLFPAESRLLGRTLIGADARQTLYAIGQTVSGEGFEHSI